MRKEFTKTETDGIVSKYADVTYKILRFYLKKGKKPRVIARNMSLEDAKKHCSRPDTKGNGWFDGFTREGNIQ